MTSQQKTFLAIALVAVLGAALYRRQALKPEAPAPLTPVNLVFVTGGSGPYWQIIANGAKRAADDFQAKVDIQMPSDAESVPEQTAILDKIDAKKVGGVAVSPLDAAGQTPLIDKLAGDAFVITFDSDAPDSKRRGYVGTSNFAAGRVCARLAKEVLPQGGKVAILMANATKDNLLDRKGGFQEALAKMDASKAADDKSAPIEVVGWLVDEGSDKKTAELIAQALTDHADLGCIIGLNAQHGPIIRKVLKDVGVLGKVKIIAFDEADETLAGIEAGDIYATVAQDPYRYGYETVRMLSGLCRADKSQQPIGTTTLSVQVEAIKKDNLGAYREKVKTRQASSGHDKAKDAS